MPVVRAAERTSVSFDDVAVERWIAAGRNPQDLNDLVVQFSPLVKYIAGRLRTGMPRHVESEELVSSGLFGLFDAFMKFNPELGVPFAGYAGRRIRGAIIDGVRDLDWVPRSIRRKGREVAAATERVRVREQRDPTDAEVAAELGLSLDGFMEMLNDTALMPVMSLNEPLRSGEDAGMSMMDLLADVSQPCPEGDAVQQDAYRVMKGCIKHLPNREYAVVMYYHFEGMVMHQIADVMGLTESRISQIHTQALLLLRGYLEEAFTG